MHELHYKSTVLYYFFDAHKNSSTLGAQRPTLTFGNDKVRFIGN